MTHVAEQTMPHTAQSSGGFGPKHYVAEYQQTLRQGRSQPSWVREARERGIAQFERLGFPTTRLEDWKFTSVAPITERRFSLAGGVERMSPATVSSFALPSLATIAVCVNGRFAPRLSSLNGLPEGVRVLGLEQTLASEPELVESHLTKIAGLAAIEQHAFAALNTAFLQDGIVIMVPPRLVVETPIQVLFFSAPANGSPAVSHPRLLIVAGESSQVRIVERYAGTGGPSFSNAVTEVALAPNAVVDHYKLQEEAADAFHIGVMHLRADRHSNFSSHSLAFGGALVRNDVVAVLDGEGIDCTLNGLYLARGRQLIDNHTTIDHAKPHCGSHEIYKGILGEQARAVFNGKIVVRPDAQKTDAKQTNKALLLSDDAQINTKPQLEIFANDVKCTHGAAIGQLDEDAMFYLRSRGLGFSEARGMLIHAFAGDILSRIKIAPLREHLQGALSERLPHGAA
jgi:Fe-S cluster assembly protein SufD